MALIVGGCLLVEAAYGLQPFPLSANERGTVTCLDVPDVTYDIYLPPGYSTNGPPLPIIYTMSSTGGGLVGDFSNVCSELNIIAVGLTGVSDGTGTNEIAVHLEGYAVARDIRERVLFDPTAEFASGVSGGGEAAYWLGHDRAQHWAGLLPMAAWMGVNVGDPYGTTNRVLTNLLVARTTGLSDAASIQNLVPDSNYLVSCGAVVQDFLFDGGHEVAPDFIKTDALYWLLAQRVPPGPNDQANSMVLAAGWNAQIAAGQEDAVLLECVNTLMNQPRTWNALQAELMMDRLETNYASFRTLAIDNMAKGDFAGDLFYYGAMCNAYDGETQQYYCSLRGITGVTDTNGDQVQSIQVLLQQYGYPTPILQNSIDSTPGLMNLLIEKDTTGLLYSVQSCSNLGRSPWLPQNLAGTETDTTWSAVVTDLVSPDYFRVATSPLSSTVPIPTITCSPESVTAYLGETVTFGACVGGDGPFTYAWRKNGQYLTDGGNIVGSATLNLAVYDVSPADAASYDMQAIGFSNVATTSAATLTVLSYSSNQLPTIISEPNSLTNAAQTTAVFSVVATGDGPFAYQWTKNGVNLTDVGNILGSVSTNLTVFDVSQADAASYSVIVTGFGSVTSMPPATLTVIANNTLYLYEPFDYANIGSAVTLNNPSNWALNGSGANDLNVAAGNLSYAGLSQSFGNSVTNGGAGLGVRRLFTPSQTNGQVFFSALFQINNLGYGTWNGGSAQVGALTASDNQTFRLQVMIESNSPSSYIFGVQKSGTGATITFDTTNSHSMGETVFLVGEYDFTTSPNTATLWIDPNASTFGTASPPGAGSLVATDGTDGAYVIDRFNMRQNTATSVPTAMQWDELRIGASWAAVTPPGP